MGVLQPLRLRLTNWQDSGEVEWLNAPLFPDGPVRRLPFGEELLIEQRDFVRGVAAPGYRRLAVGASVRLRYAYVVTCESYQEDDNGEVTEVLCSYDPATRSQHECSGSSTLRRGKGVVHWVHASLHNTVRCSLPSTGGTPAQGLEAEKSGDCELKCEPAVMELIEGSLQCPFAGLVQLERLGSFQLEAQPANGKGPLLRCLTTRGAPPALKTPGDTGCRSRRQRAVPTRKPPRGKAALPLDATEPLLLLCASERWADLMELELFRAWQSLGRDTDSLVLVAPGLYCARGSEVLSRGDASEETHCLARVAGLRRCLRVLCPAQATPSALVEAAAAEGLSFPRGFSLEVENPFPAAQESTAPYSITSAYMPAALARVIDGPLKEPLDNAWTEGLERTSPSEELQPTPARLLVLQVVTPERLFVLAEEQPLPASGLCQVEFCARWKARPHPDYSAALEPLAALALVSLGLCIHRALHGEVRAFLDPSCGTGTLAAAAWHCRAGNAVLAGDVSEVMSRRSAANLEKLFPDSVSRLDLSSKCGGIDERDGDIADGGAGAGSPLRAIGVRQWDATTRWPLPQSAGVPADGTGLLVAANLPWGGSLHGQEEDAVRIVRCLAQELPQATLCFIAPQILAEECSSGSWFTLLHQVAAGKKAVVVIGRGAGP